MTKFILGKKLRHKAFDNPIAHQALWLADLIAVGAILGVFGLLPVTWASALGARFGRLSGRILKGRTRHVRANLSLALPDRPPAEIARLAGEVWANAGAVLAEYPNLGRIVDPRRNFIEIDIVAPIPAYREPGRPVIFVAAHLANWEVACAAMTQLGIRSHALYAPLSNPWFDRLLMRYRGALGCRMVSRQDGLRSFITALAKGEAPAMIIDRKVAGGPPIALFGAPKPSSTLPAQLALRFEVPLVPVQVQRLPGARFRVRFHHPLRPRDPRASLRDQAFDLTRQIHDSFEAWIRARPGEWMCTSKIWPTAVLRAGTDIYDGV